MPSATIGPPVPDAAVLGGELRRTLPPALVEALYKIGGQIEVEILAPLLCAPSVEQLAITFECAFPTFRDYYVSTVLILRGFLQEDGQRFSALTIRSFRDSQNLIRSRGPQWIGQAASLDALHGLATIIRIARVAARLIEPGRSADIGVNGLRAEQWANSIVAYSMALASVLASLTALTNGSNTSVKLENVAALAHWSKSYAAQAYHLTKAIGLLKTVPSGAPADRSDEEDLFLAEAGLDSYFEALRQDDQP
jgi:hypothetical protein